MSHKSFEEELTEKLADLLLGETIPLDIVDSETGLCIVPAGKKFTRTLIRMVVNRYFYLEIDPSPIRNRILNVIWGTEKKWGK
jgi:DNA-directed RNA polymerase subunit beta